MLFISAFDQSGNNFKETHWRSRKQLEKNVSPDRRISQPSMTVFETRKTKHEKVKVDLSADNVFFSDAI